AAALAVAQQADELPARPVLNFRACDDALGLHRLADTYARERHDARVVFIAQRQVQHEVLLAQHADAGELVGEGRCGLAARPGGWDGRRSARHAPGNTSVASTSIRAPRGSAAT